MGQKVSSRLFNTNTEIGMMLPDNVLRQIFQHLPNLELQKLRMVCRSWKECIEKVFGTMQLFTNDNWFWTSKSQGARVGTFHSFTKNFPSSLPFILNLEEITFDRIVLTSNLISILQKCSNVRRLNFTGIILDSYDPSGIAVPYKICLPRLIALRIHVHSADGSVSEDYAAILKFMNDIDLTILAEFCFWCPNSELEKLSLGNLFGGVPPPTASTLSDAIFRFIRRNLGTMETVTLGTWNIPVNLYFNPVLNQKFPQKPPQLDAIQSACNLPETWLPVIRTQHYLQCLRLQGKACHFWTACCEAIPQSSEMILEVVLADTTSMTPKEVDFRIFRHCHILAKLVIQFEACTFRSVDSLPTSLKILSLKGTLTKEQISTIPDTLENLEIMLLDNCEPIKWQRKTEDEITMNSTVDLSMFKKLVFLPRIKEFTLDNFSMTWSSIMEWCVIGSVSECNIRVWLKRFRGNPFGIRVAVN